MKRRNLTQLGLEAMERLDLPGELTPGVAHMELTGQSRFFMAQHKGVLSYSTEAVEIAAGDFVVRVSGHELQLLAMTEKELRLGGVIEKVELVV